MSVMETKTIGELSWEKQNERKGSERTRRNNEERDDKEWGQEEKEMKDRVKREDGDRKDRGKRRERKIKQRGGERKERGKMEERENKEMEKRGHWGKMVKDKVKKGKREGVRRIL
jgi:hypothetical protein